MDNFVYIITDSNRTNFHVGMSVDLIKTIDNYRMAAESFFNRRQQFTRLVYVKEFKTEREAGSYLELISGYTRMQRERLVRSDNPNWINLTVTRRFDHMVISSTNPQINRSANIIP